MLIPTQVIATAIPPVVPPAARAKRPEPPKAVAPVSKTDTRTGVEDLLKRSSEVRALLRSLDERSQEARQQLGLDGGAAAAPAPEAGLLQEEALRQLSRKLESIVASLELSGDEGDPEGSGDAEALAGAARLDSLLQEAEALIAKHGHRPGMLVDLVL